MNAEIVMLGTGITAFFLTLYLVRSRSLREKYALGWIALAVLLLFIGAFPGIIMAFADYAQLSYPAAVMLAALGMIYFFAFSFSISLSRLHHKNLRLAQELALLEQRLRILETDDSRLAED